MTVEKDSMAISRIFHHDMTALRWANNYGDGIGLQG
jgi:hypothetical protein